jgi:hypothetical protein
MKSKESLLKELDEIVQKTTEQNFHYQRSKDFLYEGLAWIYLWWRKAKAEDGFLEEQYSKHNIGGHDVEGVEKFTRILRLTWRLDWADESKAKLQQWSNALRELHKEYETNTSAYKNEPKKRLVLFIESKGGLRRLIGADKYDTPYEPNDEKKPKRKTTRTDEDAQLLACKHLELGELHFATARSISSIQSINEIAVNRKGYALALIRQMKGGKYDVLATVNDDAQVKNAIISSYKRSSSVAPTVLKVLTEVIATQSLPIALEKHRYTLPDVTKSKAKDGSLMRQNKRLLFRKSSGDIILSENRTACSVVTVAKPHSKILTSRADVFLNVNDRRYLEKAIIQNRELSFYTSNDKEKIPALRNTKIAASHSLIVKNKVLDKQRAIYFYGLDSVNEVSRSQADLYEHYETPVAWTARVDKRWLEQLSVIFVSRWLNEYGEHITRPKHKIIQIDLGMTQLTFKHYGENGNLTTSSKPFSVETVSKASLPFTFLFQTKDLLPTLDGLSASEIDGKLTLTANKDALWINYKTELATYSVAIPTCTPKGKRNNAAFAAYGT